MNALVGTVGVMRSVLRHLLRAGLELAAVLAVAIGVSQFHWAWSAIGIAAGFALMVLGVRLDPDPRQRTLPRYRTGAGSPLYARDGKPFGPWVADHRIPRPSASWFDGA